MIRLFALVILAFAGLPATAATVYQCTAANGRVIYQDKPCPGTQRQQTLQLDDAQPVTRPPPAPALAATVAADTAPPPEPVEAPPPLPLMYTCISATDGKTYLSDNGDPQPYQVPYGILGAGSLPLSQVYGPPNSAGASAPELNRGRIKPGLIANYFVWVQDQCRELTPQETCHALREDLDATETKLRRAFKSDQPPLEKREQALRAQLRGC
jgi:Domain of unknown function (DUF4124)